ncbi:MAG: homoserine dehydrogenase [Clostridia bacterium]|nr:homoserine dehydrogenase [Clostridia bacterium]
MNVAIMGHGVVGSGVAEILIHRNSLIAERIKNDINIKYILDLREFNDLSYSDKFTKNFSDILNDDSVKIVAEAMGGINPAYDFVKRCLLAGKSVVTSNKELVAAKGAELIKIANEKNVNFLFEASVGGGIPVLRPMVQCLAANEITEFSGILNGTTNFILNKMIVDNMSFEDALKLAQENGYAEKDPTADIEGHDACRKVCILATLSFGKHVYPEQVATDGITKITLDDVNAADSFGCVIKLIGHAEKLTNGKITAFVRPTVVSRENMLSGVNGVFNAIMITGDQTGEVMFYGKGAGKEATASAVVADVMDCAKHLESRKYLDWCDGDDNYVVNDTDSEEKMFVRIIGKDFDSLKATFQKEFGSLTSSVTKNEFSKEICFITNPIKKSVLNEKLSRFENIEIKILHTMI